MPGSWSHLKAQLRRDSAFKLIHGLLADGTFWCRLSLRRLWCRPSQSAAHNCTPDFPPSEKAGGQNRASKTEANIFVKLKLRRTPYDFSVRDESLGPAHSHGERVTRGMNMKRQTSLKVIKNYSEGCQDEVTASCYTDILFHSVHPWPEKLPSIFTEF